MLNTLIKLSNNNLLLPLYHLVSDTPKDYVYNLYQIKTVDGFKAEIDFILKHFAPISISDIIEYNLDQKPFEKNSVYFTFDDGLKEMREVIAPLLLEKGIEAAFFVNPDFVDNKVLFYRYKAGLLINKIEKENLSQAIQSELENILDSKSFIQAILNLNYTDRRKLDQLAEILEVDFSDYLKNNSPYLSKEDLEWLINKGFAIGAHSMDHPRFIDISEEEQLNQAIDSISWVKEKLNQVFSLFAFPFTDYGVKKSFFNQLKEKVNIDLTFGCAGIKDDEILFNLQRLPMDKDSSSAKQLLKSEYRNYLLKQIIGKNKIYR